MSISDPGRGDSAGRLSRSIAVLAAAVVGPLLGWPGTAGGAPQGE
jgi:hypothetical protein